MTIPEALSECRTGYRVTIMDCFRLSARTESPFHFNTSDASKLRLRIVIRHSRPFPSLHQHLSWKPR
jgi:hypothetical protein